MDPAGFINDDVMRNIFVTRDEKKGTEGKKTSNEYGPVTSEFP